MTGADDSEPETSLDRRTFVKQSAAASLGVGVGANRQEESGLQYYNVVVPDSDTVSPGFVNKFVFTTGSGRRTRTTPFDGCFTQTERSVPNQFDRGAYVYDGVVVDATETFQLFGDADASDRLRRILEGDVNLPEALDESVGNVRETRIFGPVGAGRLPTTEGYRAVGGENCDAGYVRLRVHELSTEITSG